MPGDDGNFKADISDAAIREALASVEGPKDEGELIDPSAPEGGEAAAEQDPQVKKLTAMLEDSAARAKQTQERLKETHERYLRVAADFDNWKKRAAKEKDDATKFGNEKLLKDLIPVLDNLERALSSLKGEGSAEEAKGLVDGVKLVAKQFSDILGRYGVKAFVSVGQPFEPSKHEALMQQESADHPPNTVLSEMVRGYTLHERLIRPAAVVVSKAAAKPAASPAAAAEPPAATASDKGSTDSAAGGGGAGGGATGG